jgi:hypothetical protein
MEGFKSNPKMQCFKEGGSIKYESRKEHKEEMSADIKQDKAIVKKALAMHDKQEHPGEKTDLSKLKKGGRTKKEKGTVKKFKDGGKIGVYGAKKKSGDMDSIEKAKNIKPKLLCGGKSVRKMAAGGSAFETDPAAAQAALDTQDNIATRNMIMNPVRKAKKFIMGKLSGLSPINAAVSDLGAPVAMPSAPQGAPTSPMPQTQPVPQDVGAGTTPMKRGGKAKKMNTGGTAS